MFFSNLLESFERIGCNHRGCDDGFYGMRGLADVWKTVRMVARYSTPKVPALHIAPSLAFQ